jgi:hypothetical protein
MTIFTFGNSINCGVTSAINSTQTAIEVTNTTRFPTGISPASVLALTIINAAQLGIFEIVYVTGVSGSNLTVLRAQEGSTAMNWPDTAILFSNVTAAMSANFGQKPQLFAADGGYVDVTSSRAFNATDTNNTGRPIFVVVTVNVTVAGTMGLNVNGGVHGNTLAAGVFNTSSIVIPSGSTYGYTIQSGAATLTDWLEL